MSTYLEFATRLMGQLKEAFPRRKFVLETHGSSVYVRINGMWTHLHVRSKTTGKLRFGNLECTVRPVNVVEYTKRYLQHEADLRHKHRHQRQEMRKHVERLKKTELLSNSDLVYTLTGFSDKSNTAPVIQIAFASWPDKFFATISYNHYRNDESYRGTTQFRVSFGYRRWHVENLNKLVNLFDSTEVFKELDNITYRSDIKLLKSPTPEREMGVAAFEYDEEKFYRNVPYLLMMEAKNVRMVEVGFDLVSNELDLISAKLDSDPLAVEAIALAVARKEYRSFVVCDCRPELAWTRDYEEDGE